MGKLLVAVVIALCAVSWRLYDSLGVGRTVYNHRPGVCRQVHGPVYGSEDIELIRNEGIAFISSGVVQPEHEKEHLKGKMFLYDFNQKLGTNQLKAEEITIKGAPFDLNKFRPHGLSHWIVNGVVRLYMIHHIEEINHSVEVFDYDSKGRVLIHKKSIKHPTLSMPNDLVAVGPDQFMWTNNAVAQTKLGNTIEFLSGYKGGTVYFWDGKESHNILSGMGGPNGIAYDVKNNKIFVSELNKQRIHAYDLAKDKKSVSLVSTVNINTGGDNFFIDSDGSVYVGCHPSMLQVAKSLSDCEAETTSPSQILRVKYGKDYKTVTITEPYSNDGKEVSGSSVAVLYNNQMLIGTVCKGLLHCEVAHPAAL